MTSSGLRNLHHDRENHDSLQQKHLTKRIDPDPSAFDDAPSALLARGRSRSYLPDLESSAAPDSCAISSPPPFYYISSIWRCIAGRSMPPDNPTSFNRKHGVKRYEVRRSALEADPERTTDHGDRADHADRQDLAGYSLGEATCWRRRMRPKEVPRCRNTRHQFVEGATSRV